MPNDKNLERRIKEELEAEGEDSRSIWQKAEAEIRRLIKRIAEKLGRTFEEIWEALKRLGGG